MFLGVPRAVYPIVAAGADEPVVFPLCDDGGGRLSRDAMDIVLQHLKSCDACLIGPGLGRSREISEIVCSVIGESEVPLVIDADGINALCGNINILRDRRCPVILTPHDVEFARLGGDPAPGIRVMAARDFAVAHGCVLLLKGHRTVVAAPDGRIAINTTGNAGMAKGGSGDVLAGMITSLLGQGMAPFEAAYCAAWLHGRAGDLCADRLGQFAMTPSDMVMSIPETLKKYG